MCLRINYKDVSKRGMLAQLIVEVPIQSQKQTLKDVVTLLNVIYHQVSQQGDSYLLTYNTPYNKPAR